MSDIYYSPEAYGLRVIGEVEFSSGSYEFDTFVVWQDLETGSLYCAQDAGCSCPMPFGAYDRSNITKIERTQDLIDALEQAKSESYNYGNDWDTDRTASIDAAAGELILKAREAVRAS